MTCKNCGSEIREGAKFCPKCGAEQGLSAVGGERTVTRSKSSKKSVIIINIIAIAAILLIGGGSPLLS